MLRKLIVVLLAVLISVGFLFAESKETKKILYYRNPMNPQITSPVFMKDSMGMDYVPVYAEEQQTQDEGVFINPEKQQLIGVKKAVVRQRNLVYEINTFGRVANDPDLYVTQQEYLSALSLQNTDLSQAAKKRLLLAGMSQKEINTLETAGEPQQSLYLPDETAWLYLAIYEQDLGLVKPGSTVEIDIPAYPGEKYQGIVGGITPALDPETRTARARVEINNPGYKFKPDMYINAVLKIDLGNKLAVPEEAVLNTGTQTLVLISNKKNTFLSKEVRVGHKANGYYEVLSGLKAGDVVVTDGNFLIDSESRFQSAVKNAPESEE